MSNTQLYSLKQIIAEEKNCFSAQAGEEIGYESGAKMIKNYCDQNNEQTSEHFFGRNIIEALLAQPGAVGITVIYGVNEIGLPKPVMVAVNSKGNYILSLTTVGVNGQMSKQQGIVAGGVMSPGIPMPTDGW